MRNYVSFFDTTKLSFCRSSGDGELDENNNWVESYDTSVPVTGDLQPYKAKGYEQVSLPSGFTLRGAYLFSSKDCLNTVNDYGAKSADWVLLDNRKYFVAMKADWSKGSILSTDYNDYILALQNNPNDGVL